MRGRTLALRDACHHRPWVAPDARLPRTRAGYPTAMTSRTRLLAGVAAGLITVLPLAACSDEDRDGGTTDEEVHDLERTVSSLEQRLETEVDAQDRGSNDNG